MTFDLRKDWPRLCALALGGVFVWAAWPKLLDPPGFAQAIHNYGLVPDALRNPMALVLPWLEALCGLALLLWGLTGRAFPGAAWWAVLLLVAFILALGWNLWHHHPVDCGCFGLKPTQSPEALLKDMKWRILQDLGFLALALPLLRRG